MRSFGKCRKSEVIVPDRVFLKGRVVGIDSNAFRDNTTLKSIVIPESVVSIGDYAFMSCDSLETVVLPQSLQTIGRGAFKNCQKLKSIIIPSRLNSIPNDAFAYCASLECIDLKHVRSIGEYAFAYCGALTDIVLAEDLKMIKATSFLDSAYYKRDENWSGGILCLDKWVIGSKGPCDEYVIKSDTVGIAAGIFDNEWHIKHKRNPIYDLLLEEREISMVCPQVPTPDLSSTPEFLEEITPAKIRYEGTSSEWDKVIKLIGENTIISTIVTVDNTITAYL